MLPSIWETLSLDYVAKNRLFRWIFVSRKFSNMSRKLWTTRLRPNYLQMRRPRSAKSTSKPRVSKTAQIILRENAIVDFPRGGENGEIRNPYPPQSLGSPP